MLRIGWSQYKYLGMTCDGLNDHYILKFRLNLHKKFRGIPTGAALDSDFLQDKSAPISKKNVLSGLAASLIFSIRALFSEICRIMNHQLPHSCERDPTHQKPIFLSPDHLQLLLSTLHFI